MTILVSSLFIDLFELFFLILRGKTNLSNFLLPFTSKDENLAQALLIPLLMLLTTINSYSALSCLEDVLSKYVVWRKNYIDK